MSSTHRWSVAVAAALALAGPVSAQQDAPADVDQVLITSSASTTAPVLLFAPTFATSRFDLDFTAVAFVAPVVRDEQARESESVAMMIVGGAALVVGSVVDGDAGTLIMVGGGVIGLVGLYRYLR